MTIELKKFGQILNGRSFGREAVLRARQIMNGEKDTLDDLVLDFSDVNVVTPSFADEFLHGLKELYPKKEIKFRGTKDNPVLEDVLKTVQQEKEVTSKTT